MKTYIWLLAPMTVAVKTLLNKSQKIVIFWCSRVNRKHALSSIPPRDDDDGLAVNEKIKEVNKKFKKVAEKEEVKFIDHDSNLKYRHCSYEDELLKSDKLHLSEKGVNMLITNMGLKEKV